MRRDDQTYQLVLGSVLSGTLTRNVGNPDESRLALERGLLAGLSASKRLLAHAATGIFVLGTLSLSASSVHTRAGTLRSFDLRVGVAAGRSFGPITPYLLARAFGGPVFVPDGPTIGDDHHYVLGLGLSARLGPIDLGGEVAPLGERRLTATGGISF